MGLHWGSPVKEHTEVMSRSQARPGRGPVAFGTVELPSIGCSARHRLGNRTGLRRLKLVSRPFQHPYGKASSHVTKRFFVPSTWNRNHDRPA